MISTGSCQSLQKWDPLALPVSQRCCSPLPQGAGNKFHMTWYVTISRTLTFNLAHKITKNKKKTQTKIIFVWIWNWTCNFRCRPSWRRGFGSGRLRVTWATANGGVRCSLKAAQSLRYLSWINPVWRSSLPWRLKPWRPATCPLSDPWLTTSYLLHSVGTNLENPSQSHDFMFCFVFPHVYPVSASRLQCWQAERSLFLSPPVCINIFCFGVLLHILLTTTSSFLPL